MASSHSLGHLSAIDYFYIHNDYNNYILEGNPSISVMFNTQTIHARYLTSKRIIQDDIAKVYENSIKDLKNKNIISREEEFFNILEDVRTQKLSKISTSMAQSLSVTSMGDFYKDISSVSEIYELIDKLNNFITLFSTILTQMTEDSFFTSPETIMANILLQNNNTMTPSSIVNQYIDIYMKNCMIDYKNGNYRTQVASHSDSINKIAAELNALKELADGEIYNMPFQIASQLVKTFGGGIIGQLQKIIGLVSEDVFEEFVNNMPEFLSNLMLSDSSLGVFKLEGKKTGTQRGSILNKKTTDISLEVDLDPYSKNFGNGSIMIKIPGVSIKRTSLPSHNSINGRKIHIKETSVRNLLSRAQVEDDVVRGFFNAIANYRRAVRRVSKSNRNLGTQLKNGTYYNITTVKGTTSRAISTQDMRNIYDYMHAAFLPLALSGEMTDEDFSYFMAINNKVYTMPEIIEIALAHYLNGERSVSSNISSLATYAARENTLNYRVGNSSRDSLALARSMAVKNEILNYTLNMSIHLYLRDLI